MVMNVMQLSFYWCESQLANVCFYCWRTKHWFQSVRTCRYSWATGRNTTVRQNRFSSHIANGVCFAYSCISMLVVTCCSLLSVSCSIDVGFWRKMALTYLVPILVPFAGRSCKRPSACRRPFPEDAVLAAENRESVEPAVAIVTPSSTSLGYSCSNQSV